MSRRALLLRPLGIRFRHPTQYVVGAFAAAITVGTLLLSLPVATTGTGGAPLLTALFTSTSAVCVTGLVVVDTPSYWSAFGETVILMLIQFGGFGIMTGASLLGLVVARRIGLRQRLATATEAGAVHVGDVRQVIVGIARFMVVFEAAGAIVLAARWWITYDEPFRRAVWLGVFHSVSAYNNAGFALFTDSLTGFADDPFVIGTIAVLIVIGGIGYPVLRDLQRRGFAFAQWTLHTKLTVVTSAALVATAAAALCLFEWTNPDTLGQFSAPVKVMEGLFHAITPRTAGFNAVDYGALREESLFTTSVLMLIGGGSASTAGGIKVSTFALLAFVIWSELRGEPDVNIFGRRTPTAVQRQAVAIALTSVGAVVVGTLILLSTTQGQLSPMLFEVISAFGTVGLSQGVTAVLPGVAQVIIIVLMFVGRLGPHTFGAAIALREHDRMYRFAEERPIIG